MAKKYERVRLIIDFIRQEDGSYKNMAKVCTPTIIDDEEADLGPRDLVLNRESLEGEIPNSRTIGQLKTAIANRIKEQVPDIS